MINQGNIHDRRRSEFLMFKTHECMILGRNCLIYINIYIYTGERERKKESETMRK